MAAAEITSAGFLYFGYGSNLSRHRLQRSCPSARLVSIARLPDHRLAFTRRSERWGGGVADVLPAPGAEVWGVVWRIATEESDALDRQEGLHLDPPAYRRSELLVQPPTGEPLACRSYVVVAPSAEHIPPAAAYLETMLAGARDCGLPGPYIEQIAVRAGG